MEGNERDQIAIKHNRLEIPKSGGGVGESSVGAACICSCIVLSVTRARSSVCLAFTDATADEI